MRRIARTDANQAVVALGLAKLGFKVQTLHQVGNGVPDLLISKRGRTALVEVKTEKGRYTPAQVEFKGRWQGEIFEARTMQDVERIAREWAGEAA